MSLVTLYVFSKPFYAPKLAYLAQFFIFRQFIENSDLSCKHVSMLTLFRVAGIKIQRQDYLVMEITKPSETCYSCKETLPDNFRLFLVLILELDSPSNKHWFQIRLFNHHQPFILHLPLKKLTNERRAYANTRRMT